ncbi:MAG: fasciclin domain-containing protein [Rubricoccaceae bacterium]
MSRFLSATLGIALLLGLSACDPSDDIILEDRTIVELASDTQTLSTLVSALQTADLTSTLEGSGPFTVFAPSNDAFDAVQGDLLTAILGDDDTLDDLLTYHVVQGTFRASDLTDGQTLTALNGGELAVTIEDGDVFVEGVEVGTADVAAANGVVHVMNGVLLTPVDIIDAAGLLGFSSLASALTTAELVDNLQADGPFTVFAPTNAAFDDTDTSGLTTQQLTNVLLYHVASGAVVSGDLEDDQTISTLLTDQTIGIDINGSTITIDGDDANGVVTTADVVVGNGVIHAIDGVLLPNTF